MQSDCVAPLHAKGGRGACHATCVPMQTHLLPPFVCLFWSMLEWGALLSLHPICVAGMGKDSVHTNQGPHFCGTPALGAPQSQVRVGALGRACHISHMAVTP